MSKALTFEDCLQRHIPIIIMETRKLDFHKWEFAPTYEAVNPLRGQFLPLTPKQAQEIIEARGMRRNAVYEQSETGSRKKEDIYIAGWVWDTGRIFQSRFSVSGLKARLAPKRKELGDALPRIVRDYRTRLFDSIDSLCKTI